MKNLDLKTPVLQLLYWGHSVNSKNPELPHAHPFWQIEIIINGEITSSREAETFLLKQNSIFVIPPENIHDFKKNQDRKNEFFSFKFKTGRIPINLNSVLIEENEFSRNICRILKLVLFSEESATILSPDKQILIEYLLGNIVNYCYTKYSVSRSFDPPIIRKICEYIRTDGKNVNVEFMAGMLNCSTSYLRVYLKKTKGVSAKNFIDQECINIIKQHLQYSSLSLTQIAKMMKFPDIYAFSRFFKRVCNLSPSDYRKKAKLSMYQNTTSASK